MTKPVYWVFEGNEGTGKTTLSKTFADKMGALWTYEPNGEDDICKFLREKSLDGTQKITKYARELMFVANRSIHHENVVRPTLKNMHTVVSDRSFLSGMVYAKLNTYTFDRFFELMQLANILEYPDVLIYVTSNRRKIKKNENDIYDNASEDTLAKIDGIFEEALDYLSESKITKKTSILRFENDFDLSSEENYERLLSEIKKIS